MIIDSVSTRQELFDALAARLYPAGPGASRPAPRTLDGLADMLRESGVTRVSVRSWNLDRRTTVQVIRVFRDLGVTLSLGH